MALIFLHPDEAVTPSAELNGVVPVPPTASAKHRCGDLAREVYGFLGLPLDAVNFNSLLRSIDGAARQVDPFLISTPNVNFLVASRRSALFRESLLCSDICIADGMPLIWIARLLGIPITQRVAGADLFQTLKLDIRTRPLRVFLFGGADGVAQTVAAKLNGSVRGLECVGALNPGFGTVDEISSDAIIDAINASRADLLAVFLGAEKAQSWLLKNYDRIKIPVRAQFGAAINFEAGSIKRAPPMLRNSGLEWLWRIKEEPFLWRRYWRDGLALFKLFLLDVLPLATITQLARSRRNASNRAFRISEAMDGATITMQLSGTAARESIDLAIEHFESAIEKDRDVVLDLAEVDHVDHRFIGLILMLRKQLGHRRHTLQIMRPCAAVRRVLRLNGFGFLLSEPGRPIADHAL